MKKLEDKESLLDIGQRAFIYVALCLLIDRADIIIVIDIK